MPLSSRICVVLGCNCPTARLYSAFRLSPLFVPKPWLARLENDPSTGARSVLARRSVARPFVPGPPVCREDPDRRHSLALRGFKRDDIRRAGRSRLCVQSEENSGVRKTPFGAGQP